MSKSFEDLPPPPVCLDAGGDQSGGDVVTSAIGPVMRALLAAAIEGHDEARLRDRMRRQILAALATAPCEPHLPDYLRTRLAHQAEKLSWYHAERVLEVLEAAGKNDTAFTAKLFDLRLTVSRIGGVFSAMHISRRLMVELAEGGPPGIGWLS